MGKHLHYIVHAFLCPLVRPSIYIHIWSEFYSSDSLLWSSGMLEYCKINPDWFRLYYMSLFLGVIIFVMQYIFHMLSFTNCWTIYTTRPLYQLHRCCILFHPHIALHSPVCPQGPGLGCEKLNTTSYCNNCRQSEQTTAFMAGQRHPWHNSTWMSGLFRTFRHALQLKLCWYHE